jgi:transposase
MSLADKGVRLTADQRETLGAFIRTGKRPAALIRRAHVLLKADADGPDAWTDERIAEAFGTTRMTARRVRQPFAREGLEATLHRKLDGKQEAQLIALACSKVPDGRAKWTMVLLAERLAEMKVVYSIDPATV